jgi:hypothetical protein
VAAGEGKQPSKGGTDRKETEMGQIKGSCLCGAIHYQSSAEPSKMIASDCRHCQKQSGVAISISVGVPGESLSFQGMRPTVYEDVRDSGAVILRSFCPNCGTPLFSETDDEPDLVFIKTASLDDPSAHETQTPPIFPHEGHSHSAKTRHAAAHVVDLLERQKRLKVS